MAERKKEETDWDEVAELVYRVKLAEQAERYEEMVTLMRQVIGKKATQLSFEERNLLSVAYKNIVGAKRISWRIIFTLESKEKQKTTFFVEERKQDKARQHEVQARLCQNYRQRIEAELRSTCEELLTLLKKHLIPKTSKAAAASLPPLVEQAMHSKMHGVESLETSLQRSLDGLSELVASVEEGGSLVFFFKMMGDYYRYLAEFTVDNADEAAAGDTSQRMAMNASLAAYYVANEIAKIHLEPTHPIRLGLALNFSVFYYEILSQPDKACQLATNAFDAAVVELDQVNEETYKDSTLIMQWLKDNLNTWKVDLNDGEEATTQLAHEGT